MADPKLDVLESRLEILENSIFGRADKDSAYPKIIDTLGNISGHINASVSGRPKIENALKRLGELEKYLDPVYTESLTLSPDAKAEIILAEEDLLRQQAANLEKIKNMGEILGSEHIKAVPALQNKMNDLCKIHIQQQDEASGLTEETKELLLKYNTIITLLSKQFVQWEELVTRLEMAALPQKVID